MTINENRFNIILKEGMDKYKAALDAKSPQNKTKHAHATIEKMEKAIQLAEITTKKDKLPYIWEYMTLSQTIIGLAAYEAKDIKEAVIWYKKARESNNRTLGNQETVVRELYITERLLNIALIQQNFEIANDFAEQMLPFIKRLMDLQKRIDYIMKIKEVFIKTKNLDWIQKCYDELEKTCKKAEGDFRKAKAGVWLDYAKYCEVVLKKKKKARELYSEAAVILKEFKLDEEAKQADAKAAELK